MLLTAARLALAARVLVATVGAYTLAAVTAFALGRLLPGERVEAALWGTLASFPVIPAVAIWAISAANIFRACALPVLAASLLLALGWIAGSPA